MNIIETKILAIRLMTKHELSGWIFQFDNSVRRFGRCRPSKKLISISRPLSSLNGSKVVQDVILHEIAHALAPTYSKHNHNWKRIALDIGCDGRRGYNTSMVNTPPKKWIGVCPSKHEIKRNRRARLSCHKCQNTFNVKYLFKYKLNK